MPQIIAHLRVTKPRGWAVTEHTDYQKATFRRSIKALSQANITVRPPDTTNIIGNNRVYADAPARKPWAKKNATDSHRPHSYETNYYIHIVVNTYIKSILYFTTTVLASPVFTFFTTLRPGWREDCLTPLTL